MTTRPILRYYGGKWRLAPWIVSQFPAHRVYVEPFGGAASVLMHKDRSYAEVYNDLDGEIVNLFRVARDDGEKLIQKIELTPYSRADFNESFEPASNPIERARRTIIRSHMGFGGNLTRPNRDQSPPPPTAAHGARQMVGRRRGRRRQRSLGISTEERPAARRTADRSRRRTPEAIPLGNVSRTWRGRLQSVSSSRPFASRGLSVRGVKPSDSGLTSVHSSPFAGRAWEVKPYGNWEVREAHFDQTALGGHQPLTRLEYLIGSGARPNFLASGGTDL